MAPKDARLIEYGDFQTPEGLADQIAALLSCRGLDPVSVVEPTFGSGSFVAAAIKAFRPSLSSVLGLEINPRLVEEARTRLADVAREVKIDLREEDFFSFDWHKALASIPEPLLIVGNPPWATSSSIGAIGGTNLPQKTNFQGHSGLDAVTGKSNFDITEWMVIRLMKAAGRRRATVAMLMKTSVARRILTHAWRTGLPLIDARLFTIDAQRHFGVATAAGLLLCELGPGAVVYECPTADLEQPDRITGSVGWRAGMLVANVGAYDRHRTLLAPRARAETLRWRSGVKHDCTAVMELRTDKDGALVNGFGVVVEIEPDFLYPMLKGSDIANGRLGNASRFMLVTQRRPGDDTSAIARVAPKTWRYLCSYSHLLDARGSSIYRKRPRFSVFGVGEYTFSPWKVATTGFYKRLSFVSVGPIEGRPVVLDDTGYHLSFDSAEEAARVTDLLNGPDTRSFFEAFIFWDAKRPVTVDLLRRLDLGRLVAHIPHDYGQSSLDLLAMQ